MFVGTQIPHQLPGPRDTGFLLLSQLTKLAPLLGPQAFFSAVGHSLDFCPNAAPSERFSEHLLRVNTQHAIPLPTLSLFIALSVACLDGACLFICYCLPQLSCQQGVPRQTLSINHLDPGGLQKRLLNERGLSRPPGVW